MNSRITVDLQEDILLETDIYPTTEELLAMVCEQPFFIDLTLKQILPQIKKYTEDNFGCNLDVNTLCTIEGHTSVEVKIKHFVRNDTASLAILKDDDLVSLMQSTVRILAALLPLPYSICKCCKNKQKCKRCP